MLIKRGYLSAQNNLLEPNKTLELLLILALIYLHKIGCRIRIEHIPLSVGPNVLYMRPSQGDTCSPKHECSLLVPRSLQNVAFVSISLK